MIISLIGWVGAAIMVAASFNMASPSGLIMAIAGLALLTIQAAHNRTINLVILNVSSIIGFIYAFYI